MAGCESVCCVLRPLRAPTFVVVAQKLGPVTVPGAWMTLEGTVDSVERYAFPISRSNGKSSVVADESRYWIVYPGADLAAVLRLEGYADARQGGWSQEPRRDKVGSGVETYTLLLLPLIALSSHDPSLGTCVCP